jgi:hypothetical protein
MPGPKYGSVEMFAVLLRIDLASPDDLEGRALAAVRAAVTHPSRSDGEKAEHVRNALAAFDLVLSELAAKKECSDECAARPEEWPCLDDCPAQVAARGGAR